MTWDCAAYLAACSPCADDALANPQGRACVVMPLRGGAPDAKEAALGESGPESSPYEFPGGYPSPETVQRAYDDADLNRAVQAYRFFFASVSGLAIFKGNEVLGLRANSVFGTLATEPKHAGLTLNSDTPYAPLPLDLRDGPMVISCLPGR